MALTPKQKLFVEFYVGEALFNATRAAKLAGYGKTVYSTRRAGCDNLKIPEIREAVEAAMAAKVNTGAVMAADDVLRELSDVARTPLSRLDGNGDLIATEARDIKNKVSALALLAKYHGLLVDRLKIETDVTKLSDQELEAIVKAES